MNVLPRWLRWFLGVGAVLVVLAVASTHLRLAPFREISPVLSTRTKGLLIARSIDGLHFEVDSSPLTGAPATSQTHLRTDEGELRVIGTDTTDLIGRDASGRISDPKLSTLFTLNPKTNTRDFLRIEPCINPPDGSRPPVQCVDPTVLSMADGRTVLMYVRMPGRGDPAFATGNNQFLTAISLDGETWTHEPGVRFAAKHAADPDLVRLPDGRWRLYYTAGIVDNPKVGGGGAPGILSAISRDGRTFVAEPGLRAYPCSASTTVVLQGGGYRLYCHTREIFAGPDPSFDPASYLASFRSSDGLDFVLEPGARVDADPISGARFIGVEAPSVTVEEDGSITMVLTTVIEEYFPWNWLLLRKEQAHQEQMQAQASRRGKGQRRKRKRSKKHP